MEKKGRKKFIASWFGQKKLFCASSEETEREGKKAVP